MKSSLGSDRGITVTAQNINETSTTQMHKLGERLVKDERVFRYVQCKTEALTAGRGAATMMSPKHDQYAGATVVHDVGNTSITVTPDADLTANELAGGYLCYKSTRFFSHKILSHPAIASAADGLVEIETPITDYTITIDSTTIVMFPSIWKVRGHIAGNNGVTFVGVPVCSVVANSYAWLQTWGPILMAPGEFYGAAASEKRMKFATDGSMHIYAETEFGYQYAGFLLPDTYVVGTVLADLTDNSHLMMLTVSP